VGNSKAYWVIYLTKTSVLLLSIKKSKMKGKGLFLLFDVATSAGGCRNSDV
jgi:hypothetical protein